MHSLSSVFADVARFPVNMEAPMLAALGSAVCIGCLLLLLLVGFFLLRGQKKTAAPKLGLEEDLSTYPSPPPRQDQLRLTVRGRASRVRLVVLAPVGKRDLREFGEPEELLNRVVHGLGAVARARIGRASGCGRRN